MPIARLNIAWSYLYVAEMAIFIWTGEGLLICSNRESYICVFRCGLIVSDLDCVSTRQFGYVFRLGVAGGYSREVVELIR